MRENVGTNGPQNDSERELLSLISNSKDPEKAIKIAYALLIAFTTDEAFAQKVKELYESGDTEGMKALTDSIIKDI